MAHYQETSMAAVFANRAEEYMDKACVSFKNPQGIYEDISWDTMNERIRDLAMFLISKGIKPGDKVALFSPNRWEWWVTDLAICATGAVNVPIYATNAAEESKFIIENSDSVMCLTGEKEHLDRILQVQGSLKKLKDIVVFDDNIPLPSGVISLQEALAKGNSLRLKDESKIDKRLSTIKPGDLATLIYTSGTTGNPKGVMLSHSNFLANVRQCYNVAPDLFAQDHTLLSFLPLSHSFERSCGYYLPIYSGKKVAFAEDFSKILENLQEVRPTFIVSVPRLYEKIHSGILSKVSDASPFKKALFKWAMSLAGKNLDYVCNDKPRTGLFAFQYALADRLIFSKLKTALGMDRLRFAVSGGGPLSVSDAEFFLGMDIKVVEGFGLSETTPVTNVNLPWKIKPGTIGPAVIDTEIKISDEGEMLVKGPQVMIGYYKNDVATKEVFTKDGFLKTGDIAEIDSDGYVKITGRIKDLIITSGGKNISPQNIENNIKASPYVEQVAVIGDNRKYLSALIVPAFEELEHWATANNIEFANRMELLNSEKVRQLFEKEVSDNTRDFARVEQIRKFTLLDREWSQETDELTPTLKVKRRIINKKFEKEINNMYPND